MRKQQVIFLLTLILILLPVFTGAEDFGLLLNQSAGLGNTSGGNSFNYSASALPRFSFLVGDTGSLFLSAGLTFEYAGEEANFVPELMRTEFSMLFGAAGIRAGRITYSTPMPFTAAGLFDGFHVTHTSGMGKFGLGVWYTGLLCKKSLSITMTEDETAVQNMPIDYENFADTYFASKRLIVSAEWEHPSLLEMFSLKTAVTAQFDLNDHDTKYNSQYLTLKMSMPVDRFMFELGGIFAMCQSEPKIDAAGIALAGELGITYTLPTSFNSRLSFNMTYASGKTEGVLDAFVPITVKKYGSVLQSKITGLTVLSLDYSARVTEPLGISFSASYFIRNDLMMYDVFPIQDSGDDGYLLGGEFSGQFVWSPFSDLQVIFGGGVFIPAMGDIWSDVSPVLKANLLVILSVL
jgi:hypothetical protein